MNHLIEKNDHILFKSTSKQKFQHDISVNQVTFKGSHLFSLIAGNFTFLQVQFSVSML